MKTAYLIGKKILLFFVEKELVTGKVVDKKLVEVIDMYPGLDIKIKVDKKDVPIEVCITGRQIDELEIGSKVSVEMHRYKFMGWTFHERADYDSLQIIAE